VQVSCFQRLMISFSRIVRREFDCRAKFGLTLRTGCGITIPLPSTALAPQGDARRIADLIQNPLDPKVAFTSGNAPLRPFACRVLTAECAHAHIDGETPGLTIIGCPLWGVATGPNVVNIRRWRRVAEKCHYRHRHGHRNDSG
jgi:hypothetical protein